MPALWVVPVVVAAISCLVATKWVVLPGFFWKINPVGVVVQPPPPPPSPPHQDQDQDDDDDSNSCEGYWPSVELCLELGTARPTDLSVWTEANAGCPQWRINQEWATASTASSSTTAGDGGSSSMALFVNKLRNMEQVARDWEAQVETMDETGVDLAQLRCSSGSDNDATKAFSFPLVAPITISRYRGLAWSRIEENSMAGNSEYHHHATTTSSSTIIHDDLSTTPKTICWTDALLDYVEKFGVEPSSKFQDFVTTFDLQKFQDDLKTLKACSTHHPG